MPPNPKGGGANSRSHNTIEEGIARMTHSGNVGGDQVVGETDPPSTLDIKKMILEGNKAIPKNIDRVAATVALLCQDMDRMEDLIKDLGTGDDDIEELLGPHASQRADQERRLQQHESKLADLWDQSRCNKMCILGLSEGTETVPVELFLEVGSQWYYRD
ncbi:hypothetical protein NDU88_005192 [Pleurodeles waltl]|uniref:Uncharacterized protein n=1 Tax=Pleurodeles waltl TaxID=8319 RepID=A0AAV7PEN4_PLEWA|nr:hypothetical protein NDU88_005192 [Pleurodeles waltl]